MRVIYRDFYYNIKSRFSEGSVEMIISALTVAHQKLDGMTRYNGEPFIMHSINCANIVISEIGLGRNSTISTILHDVVRLGMMSTDEAGRLYDKPCVGILKGLCSISEVNTNQSKEQADNFRDLIVSYSSDPRVILIKLADRLEVMRSISSFPEVKRVKKSWESLNLYAQLAHKLGLYSIKSELEDIALSHLEEHDYNLIRVKLEDTAQERQKFISRFLLPIEEKLNQSGIKYHIKSRTKSIYSIWTKMQKMKIPFEEVYDIFALRIIIDSPLELEKPQCWNVYSVVTDFYTPNPNRMRDWISIPKSNGYESLHTTVVTKDGHWVEIQIRSERMDEVAERGIAAHWRYKGVNQGGVGSDEWLSKLREMMESDTDTQNLATKFDTQLSSKEIFIFTPNGDLRKMNDGATVLDFAFDIHTNLGSTCTGAKINQRNVPIKERLRNGDIVEILTAKSQKPKIDWLNFTTTNKARNKIKSFLREEQAKASSLGREELERKIKNWKLSVTIDDAVTILCKHYKLRTGTELYGQIASERVDISDVKEIIIKHLSGEGVESKVRGNKIAIKSLAPDKGDALIIDDTIKDLGYKLARCCNPICGDNVFGFVTISTGITIHREDCPNALSLQGRFPYRVLPARWRSTSAQGAFRATIKIIADDTAGMVNKITETINRDLKLNIRSMSLNSSGGTVVGLISVEVSSVQVVDAIIYSIIKVKGVQKVYRVNN